MRGLRRGRVPAQGNGAARRHDLLSRLLAPIVSVAVLAALVLLAAAPPHGTGEANGDAASGGTSGTSAAGSSSPDPDGAAGADGDAPQRDRVELGTPTSEPAQGLDVFYDQTISWHACDVTGDGRGSDDDRCGTVRVPVDYLAPRGETVEIALRKVPAGNPKARKGTLFINPGGPGASGLEFAMEARDFFSDDVREVWDVVGFDPRGIGESGGFACLRSRDLDAMYAADPTPDTKAEKAAAVASRTARLQGCLARGGALARNMGSEQVARDLDVMRDAVGDAHLNYYGISYGTLIGALYGAQFPDRIGLMVIDSAVSPDYFASDSASQDAVDGWAEDEAATVEDGLDAFLQDCVDQGDCALGDDVDTARTRLLAFLDRLDRKPLPSDAQGIPRLTEGWAVTAINAVLLYPDSWADVEDALHVALEDGDGTDLVWTAMDTVMRDDDGSYVGGYEESHLPIHCADWPLDATSQMEPSASVLAEHPVYAHLHGVPTDSCEGWVGTQRTNLILTVDATSPVLVLANERDLTTPPDGTREMGHGIFGSRFVLVDADGHGVYANGNDCADAIVDDYLVRGLAPRNGEVCDA
ncbi:alpha/beta hydrolase [Terracoccus sp. 273MFTsu3.1]|uniref:alpha/beta hydrolase n=1 Tax=Terracoccus sp. 273MFTsu3.1 TaxID=1172188 RepID=UPI00037337CF|nr:alpha/beta hydrolase [Terracoccus sp. 273MFTsu3.1]